MAEVVFYGTANQVPLSLNEALIKNLWHCFNRKNEIITKCELYFLQLCQPKFWRKPGYEWVLGLISVKVSFTSALEQQLLDSFQLSPSALGHFHVCLQRKPVLFLNTVSNVLKQQ